MRSTALLLIVTILLFLLPLSARAEITAYAQIDKNTVALSDYVVLNIVVAGASDINPPVVKGMENFTQMSASTSQNIQVINGQVSAATTFTYILIPKRTGVFPIGESDITAQGLSLHTKPLKLVVSDSAQTPQNNIQPNSPPNQTPQNQTNVNLPNIGNDEISLEADIDNKSPYKNEQLIYTIRAYFKQRLEGGSIELPDFKDFIIEPLDERQQYETAINGERYVVSEQAYALFPTKAGAITIPSATLSGRLVSSESPLDAFFGSYDSRPISIKTKPVTTYVRELPQAPDNYLNVVGEFEIGTEINKVNLMVGETAKLKIIIWGKGNIQNIQNPEFKFNKDFTKHFKIYRSNPVTQIISKTDYIYGQKIFNIDVVALDPGDYYIPAAEYSYFNPKTRMYHQLRSSAIHINVKPNTSTEQLGLSTAGNSNDNSNNILDIQDIIGIHTTDNALKNQTLSINNFIVLGILFIFPLISLLGSFLFIKHKEHEKDNTPQIRKKQAYRKAIQQLNKLKPLIKQQDSKKFFDQLDQVIKQYVGDKLNIPSGSLTSNDVATHLEGCHLKSSTVLFVAEILKLCELAQYSTLNEAEIKIDIAFKDSKRILNLLEKELKKC